MGEPSGGEQRVDDLPVRTVEPDHQDPGLLRDRRHVGTGGERLEAAQSEPLEPRTSRLELALQPRLEGADHGGHRVLGRIGPGERGCGRLHRGEEDPVDPLSPRRRGQLPAVGGIGAQRRGTEEPEEAPVVAGQPRVSRARQVAFDRGAREFGDAKGPGRSQREAGSVHGHEVAEAAQLDDPELAGRLERMDTRDDPESEDGREDPEEGAAAIRAASSRHSGASLHDAR
jgi:hypothetical protein